ncbi:MAG: DMT family transporter [Methyloligellaceae bacterium]
MSERAGFLYGLGGVFIFGLTLPATRVAVTGLDPWFVGLGRGVLAGLAAALLLAVTRQGFPPRESWRALALTAAGVVLGFPLFATIAMQHVPAAHGGVVLAILPLATAAAGVIVGREKPSAAFWLCGAAGTLAVLAFTWIDGDGLGAIHQGDLPLLLAVVCAAAGYAAGGELSRRLDSWLVISWALVISVPFLLLLLVLRAAPIDWNAAPQAWAGFFYLAFFSQFIGFFAWYRGLALGGVAKVGQIQLLQPFVTLFAAALLLGEHLTLPRIAFAALVVLIVALGRRVKVERRNC